MSSGCEPRRECSTFAWHPVRNSPHCIRTANLERRPHSDRRNASSSIAHSSGNPKWCSMRARAASLSECTSPIGRRSPARSSRRCAKRTAIPTPSHHRRRPRDDRSRRSREPSAGNCEASHEVSRHSRHGQRQPAGLVSHRGADRYPITPSTEGGELFQQSFAEGRLNVFGRSTLAIEAEGEHAAQGGAIAHSVCGRRVVSFTSGQGRCTASSSTSTRRARAR